MPYQKAPLCVQIIILAKIYELIYPSHFFNFRHTQGSSSREVQNIGDTDPYEPVRITLSLGSSFFPISIQAKSSAEISHPVLEKTEEISLAKSIECKVVIDESVAKQCGI